MKAKTIILVSIFLTGWGLWAMGQPGQSPLPFPVLKGPYLGQTPPGAKAELFAPGIVSTGMSERAVAISPDGREIYFELAFGRIVTIMTTKLENGKWTEPAVAPFAADARYYHFEPCLSADGRRMMFLSNRPQAGNEPKPGWGHQHIWASDRRADGTWGEPYDLGDPINSADAEYFPSLTAEGTLYFTRSKTTGEKPMIWRSRLAEGKYQRPEALPAAVNGQGTPFNAFIAPDESCLIACVDGRKDSPTPGQPTYFIFFRDPDDRWSEGVSLGPEVNFPGAAASAPYVTRDGKYLFFGSNRAKPFDFSGRTVTSRLLLDYFSGPQNGGSDIYWIEAAFLAKLRRH